MLTLDEEPIWTEMEMVIVVGGIIHLRSTTISTEFKLAKTIDLRVYGVEIEQHFVRLLERMVEIKIEKEGYGYYMP